MAKVGSDKRLNYYQQTVEQVLDEVRSHPYGLTNPEAARRVEQSGYNRLPTLNDQNWSKLAIEQAQTPTVLILTACLAVSWYIGLGSAAWASFVAALAVVASGVRRELRTTNITYHLDSYLPEKVTVRRNDKEKTIDSLELALGDIVLLGPDDIIPADLRLTEVSGLLLDETLLFGAGGHVSKYSHPLVAHAPLNARHNLAFQSSRVVSGYGAGVVIASGGQTELGRILHLSRTSTDHRSLFHDNFRRIGRTFGVTAVGLVVAITVAAKWSGLTQHEGLVSLQTLLAALAPAGIAVTATMVFGQFRRLSKHRDVQVESLAAVDRLSRVDVMLLDEAGLLTGNTPLARTFMIGKRQFSNPAEVINPTLRLLGPTGRKLGKSTARELGLFFDALALGSHATLLKPDGDHPEWHIAGNKLEGALVALAAQAGIDIGQTRQSSALLRDFPHDVERSLSSIVRQYDHRNMVFVHGKLTDVLSKSTKIWDAGHTRKISATDRTRLEDFADTQAALGLDTVVIAYRPLTAKEKPEKLTENTAEKDLTILGLVAVGHPLKSGAIVAVEAARTKGIAVSLLGASNQSVTLALASQLGFNSPKVLTDADVSALDNSRLSELVKVGSIFMHLSPEQRMRLVDVSEATNRRTMISGSSLADLPALRHASVGASIGSAPSIVRSEADIVAKHDDPHSLTRAHGRAIQTTEHLTESIWAALTNHAAAVWLVAIGFVLMTVWHIPLAVTAIQLLLLNALIILPPSIALSRDKSHRRFSSEDSAAQLAYHSHWSSVFLGLIAAVLVGSNFLYFFARQGLNPNFIDAGSQLYAQAATIGFATLVICGCINILFVRAEKLPLFSSRQLWHNAALTWSILLSLGLLAAFVYIPVLQRFAGTGRLASTDWLTAVLATLIYGGVRYITHVERLHSRHAIVQLHHEIHGHDSPAKV